jgi:hypothetical protein
LTTLVTIDKLSYFLNVILNFTCTFLLLKRDNLFSSNGLNFSQLFEIVFNFPNLGKNVLMKGGDFLFEFIKIIEDILGEKGKDV